VAAIIAPKNLKCRDNWFIIKQRSLNYKK